MQIAQRAPKTQSATVGITARELLELKFFLSGLIMANKSFSETVAWWQTKNEKKLNALLKKLQAEDKAIDTKYVAVNERGQMLLWDKVAGGFTCAMRERADGSIAFVDANDVELPEMEKEMYFQLENPELQEEYDKAKDAYSTTKRDIKVEQINRALLENIIIPTAGAASQGAMPRKLNRELFYDTLVMPDEDDQEEDEKE